MKKVICIYICDECGKEQSVRHSESLAPAGWIKVQVSQVNSRVEGLFCSSLCLESRVREERGADTPEGIRRNYAMVDIFDKLRASRITPETAVSMLVSAGFNPMKSRELLAELASRYSRNQQGE